MIAKLLFPLKVIFSRQGLPTYPYAYSIDNAFIADGVLDPEYVYHHRHTNKPLVLLNCHYNPKFGEYVYWCSTPESLLSGDESLQVAIPESYIIVPQQPVFKK